MRGVVVMAVVVIKNIYDASTVTWDNYRIRLGVYLSVASV